MRRHLLLLLGALLLIPAQHACSKAKPAEGPAAGSAPPTARKGTLYGAAIEGTPITVAEFLKDPAALEGQTVVLEGTLAQVCQDMGCWFYLKDLAATDPNAPQAYIDLQMGAVFVIPEKSAGKHGVVMGRVEKEGSKWKLIGKGVELS